MAKSKKNSDEEVDFTRNPYKGIFSLIAKREQRSSQSVHQAYYLGNPHIVSLVNKEVAKRKKAMEENKRLTGRSGASGHGNYSAL